jgi:hypothetical protein
MREERKRGEEKRRREKEEARSGEGRRERIDERRHSFVFYSSGKCGWRQAIKGTHLTIHVHPLFRFIAAISLF